MVLCWAVEGGLAPALWEGEGGGLAQLWLEQEEEVVGLVEEVNGQVLSWLDHKEEEEWVEEEDHDHP